MQKHAIFDFDGVIGDTWEDNYEIVRCLHDGVTAESYRDHHNGNVYAEPNVPFTDETAAEFFKQYNEMLSIKHVEASVEPLQQLGQEYRLHVVSSNCESAIRRVFTEAGVIDLFGLILGKEAHESKVEKFRHLADAEGFSLDDTVYVTDTLGDLKEAAKIPLRTVAVTFGYHPRDYLELGDPTALADNWDEVMHHVRQLVG